MFFLAKMTKKRKGYFFRLSFYLPKIVIGFGCLPTLLQTGVHADISGTAGWWGPDSVALTAHLILRVKQESKERTVGGEEHLLPEMCFGCSILKTYGYNKYFHFLVTSLFNRERWTGVKRKGEEETVKWSQPWEPVSRIRWKTIPVGEDTAAPHFPHFPHLVSKKKCELPASGPAVVFQKFP